VSDQLEILIRFSNDRVMELVRGRLLEGRKFFQNKAMLPEYSRSEVKLALLLVRLANPKETFTADEESVMDGRQRKLEPFKAQ
jgi:hypothetical protein